MSLRDDLEPGTGRTLTPRAAIEKWLDREKAADTDTNSDTPWYPPEWGGKGIEWDGSDPEGPAGVQRCEVLLRKERAVQAHTPLPASRAVWAWKHTHKPRDIVAFLPVGGGAQ
jgi:hypothetical protein